MRQHAIPQNILDVEFKLFTKFTLKEFAYLAIGIGFGGVAIYMVVSNIIPGILGIPIFILSSGAGIFLGLVPINDQDADVFVKNYITAITTPTQRVWLSKDMKTQRQKPLVKPDEEGRLVHKDTKIKKKKIIGENIQTTENTQSQTIEEEKPDVFEKGEGREKIDVDPENIYINPENISSFQLNIGDTNSLPGNINVWLSTKGFQPIPNVIGYLKTDTDKVLYANKTGPNGYFLTNKAWDPGKYILEFEHPEYKFPKVVLELEKSNNKSPIKISNL